MPDPGRSPELAGPPAGELEQARRELRASLALARLSAIDAELRQRRDGGRRRTVIYLCSCGFGTDDAAWFDGHLFQHPGHDVRPMMW